MSLPVGQRLGRAIDLRLHLDQQAYYKLLGAVIAEQQEIWPHREVLRRDLVGLDAERRMAMMSVEEQDLWVRLPRVVEVYRGCYWENVDGIAWSLVPGLASSFPFLAEFRREASALLVAGDVERDHCLVKLNGRRVDIISAEVMAGQPVQVAPRGH